MISYDINWFNFDLSVIHDPDDPYLGEYDEEMIVMLTDYHHVDSKILLKAFFAPGNDGEEVSLYIKNS